MNMQTIPALESQAARIAELERLLSFQVRVTHRLTNESLSKADAALAHALSAHSMSLLHMFALDCAIDGGNAPGAYYVTEALDALECPEGISVFLQTLQRASELLKRGEELPSYDPKQYGI